MTWTRSSRSGRPDVAVSRRNANRLSQIAATRTRTLPRPNYAEESTESGDDSDAQSAVVSQSAESGLKSDLESSMSPLAEERASRLGDRRKRLEHFESASSKKFVKKKSRTTSGAAGTSKASSSRGKRSRPSPPSTSKRRKLLAQGIATGSHIPDEFIPDWRDPRVPFQCWTDIFLYAAREGSTEVLSNSWLIQAATTCRLFAEPALTAIYRCPTIKNTAKAKRLAVLLERPSSETLYNYRVKVEALHINVQIVPQPLLFQLISPLIRLKELIIFTPMDQPPYRELDMTLRWHYSEDIFRALDGAATESSLIGDKPFPTALKSWEWSGRFLGGYVPTIEAISGLHKTLPFSQLTRLSLTNFQVPSLKHLQIKPDSEEKELQTYEMDGATIQAVAQAISALASLKHLVFESSTVLNDRLLPLLPKSLVHFELINCWEVRSEDLSSFLCTHGSELKTLTLMHNQSLDLGFLTNLADTCPKLRKLHINLSYYRHHDCINDADPMYDQVLLPSQIPRWPCGLRVLNIEHIRDWSMETAEIFFQSIIDSAPLLPDLRYLAIKTMLDIPWQARATMRRKWRDKMKRVFLRPFVPPNSHTTLRQPDEDEAALSMETAEPPASTSPSRRSSRIASHSQVYEIRGRHGKSMRHQPGSISYKEPDTDDEEFDFPEGKAAEKDIMESSTSATNVSSVDQDTSGEEFLHGKCTTVNVLFDNQKIREFQYSMEDFGSEESDSEEEWDGDYEDDEHVVVF
ncbi:uncharacterized protein MAM_04201 [Metarhizium album ARSEF 1941]|uniref:Uncharacterized protein n=1 Tax=Metarhizium album (strain ARSEF 1941) TaxID=1081103 RepID=A0A0B2WWL9_METAS|nr:uncharacterized protein MAM_04201 [Metarhizium album ARSEF 1941]KHN97812.1 hypothetical protein MAM_04201 [Metarhizium album ARSEF 1941]